jgi:hypothetical protein
VPGTLGTRRSDDPLAHQGLLQGGELHLSAAAVDPLGDLLLALLLAIGHWFLFLGLETEKGWASEEAHPSAYPAT